MTISDETLDAVAKLVVPAVKRTDRITDADFEIGRGFDHVIYRAISSIFLDDEIQALLGGLPTLSETATILCRAHPFLRNVVENHRQDVLNDYDFFLDAYGDIEPESIKSGQHEIQLAQ